MELRNLETKWRLAKQYSSQSNLNVSELHVCVLVVVNGGGGGGAGGGVDSTLTFLWYLFGVFVFLC